MKDQPAEQMEPSGKPSRTGDSDQPAHERSDKLNDYEDPIDDASDDSFPASDPPSFTDSTATRDPKR